MSPGYRVLPSVYDRWQQSYGSDFTTLILPRVLSTLRRFRVPVSSMLDLACGTGALALAMAKRGWRVWGVDASGEMIRTAADKLARNEPLADAAFLRQDMRGFRLPDQVGLTTCLFDSINHLLSTRDLLRTFRAVHRALIPGGYFVFDTNNERCYRTVWRNTDMVDCPEFTLVLANSYDRVRRRGRVHVTLFERRRDVYVKREETVTERWYSRPEIRQALVHAGFEVLDCEDLNFTPMEEVGKIKTWWVVRRRGEPR